MKETKLALSLEEVFVSTIMDFASKHTCEEVRELISKMVASSTYVLDNKKINRINEYLKSSK